MKINILLTIIIFFKLTISAFSQQSGFFTINITTSHLVLIDTTGAVNDIGYIGRTVNVNACGLTFYNDTLFFSMDDTLFSIDKITGLATPLVRTYDAMNGSNLYGAISVHTNGTLYLFKEEFSFSQGKLYTVDRITGTSTPVGPPCGDPSILAIAFYNGVLFGATEFYDNLLIFDLTIGVVNYYASNPLGMDFTNGMTNKNGSLYGIDITNETGSDSTRLCSINKQSGISTLIHTFHDLYTGLAYDNINDTINAIFTPEEDNHLILYPNPSNGNFSIRNPIIDGEDFSIEIFDFSGRRVFLKTFNYNSPEFQLSLKDKLSDGIYFIKVHSENKIYSNKFFVNQF